MEGGAIASASVLITADADKLHGGLRAAGNDVEKWGNDQGGKAGAGFSSSFGRMSKAGMIGAGVGIADALLGSFMDLDERAGHFEDFADNVGMSVESLQQLTHAADLAGVDVGTLEAGLQRMRLTTEGPLDEALFSFAKRLESVEDPGERAKLLFEQFGKSGVKMGTMFAQGSDGLRKMMDQATDLGMVMSREQTSQVGAAADAVNNAKKAAAGMVTGVLSQMAPAIEGVSGFITKLGTMARPVVDWYLRAWGQIGTIATIVWSAISEAATGTWAVIKGAFGSLFDSAAEMPTVQEVIVTVFRNVGIAASYVWDTIKAGAGVVSWVAGRIVQGFSFVVLAFEKVIGLAKMLPDELRPAWIDKLIGAVGEFRAKVKGTGDDMVKWGKDAWSGFGSTAATFNAWLDKSLAKAAEVKDEAKGAAAAVVEMEEKKGAPGLKFSGAVLRGTTEAFSIAMKTQFRDLMPVDPAKKVVDELKKGKKVAEKGVDKLKDIEKKLPDMEPW